MPLNMDEDAPPKRTRRSTAAGNKQKGKKGPGQQAKPASATQTPPANGSQGVAEEDENDIMAQIEKAKEELKALEAQKETLTKEITEASAITAASLPKIEHPPKGTNIQNGMKLSNDKPRYHAIRRLVTDMVAAAGINWEVRWADIPASKKAKLYQAAREQAPYLKRFSNDWATEELAKQLLKNKRGHSYRSGYLEVPEKYAYLKINAAKRRPRGHSSAKATPAPQSDDDKEGTNDSDELADTSAVATGSKSKRAASVTVATQQLRKKQKSNTGTATTAKTRFSLRANGKQKASQELEIDSHAGESDEPEDVRVLDINEVDMEE
ncbi:hypothetical protein H4582DRAFT_2080571 [Lactarius indigo]|nr:hypothetical protein H4582DRAFT_2080571 [Lactarius indigo]